VIGLLAATILCDALTVLRAPPNPICAKAFLLWRIDQRQRRIHRRADHAALV
jgi:hypothetical protein